MKRILVVGSARKSGGGVASVIRLHEQMPLWREYGCCWLETQIQAGWLTKLWYALRAAVKGFFMMPRFDIVHFHTVPDQSMTVQLPVLLWAKLWRRKVLLHIHCGNQLTMPMCTANRVAHWCMGQADGIILLAESFKPMLEEYWPEAKGKKLFVLYNPFEGNSFLNTDDADKTDSADNKGFSGPFKTPKKEKIILFAGIFNANKAPEVIVKAFAEVTKVTDVTSGGWKLVLLGSGPDEEKLRALIKDLPIEMPGYLFGREKEEYFAKASIYVMSSHYEGMPMVVLEAWSHGAAVVSTPVGGLPDFLWKDEGCLQNYENPLNPLNPCSPKNYLTFNYDDVHGLARQLQRLMADETLRTTLAENGRQLVEERFQMGQIENDLRKIYEIICYSLPQNGNF